MLRRAPLFVLAISLVIGIVIADWVQLQLWQLVAALGICVLLLLTTKQHTRPFIIFVVAAWTIAGALLSESHSPTRRSNYYGHYRTDRNTLLVTLKSPTKTSRKAYKLEVEVNQIDSTPATGRLMLFVPLHCQEIAHADIGQQMIVTGKLQKPYAKDSVHHFDYQRYLQHKGICYTLFSPSVRLLDNEPKGDLALRRRLIDIVQHLHLTESQKGIAESIFLGWKQDLDTDTRNQFRNAGISHLLCVSGLHVGIIAAMLGWLLFFCGRGPIGRKIKGLLQLLGVWFFILLSGCAPSSIRAGLLFSLFIIKDCFLLQSSNYNTLSAAAILMLLVNPNLIYDIGFQLSFSAVLGIIALSQPAYRLIPWPDEALLEKTADEWTASKKMLRLLPLRLAQRTYQLFCVSTAATLATLPLSLYHFHLFSTYFLIANMTIIPFAGLLLLSIIATLILPALSPLLRWELGTIESITSWIAALPHATIEAASFHLPQAILVALMIAILAYMLNKQA